MPFNVTPNDAGVPDYTGISRGIHAEANTSIGDLFKGLANTLSAGVKAADEQVKTNIQNDIYSNVDKVRSEYGAAEATDYQADATDTVKPAGLDDAGDRLDSLQAAYESGALKESHYWARLNAISRQLYAKYPGYRPEVDQLLSSTVGGNPANRLQSALFNEWGQPKHMTSQQKLEDWAMKNGRLPPDYYQRQSTPDAYTETELQSYIAGKTRQAAEVSDTRSQMAMAQDQNKMTAEKASEGFRSEAVNVVHSILSDSTSVLGKTYTDIQQKVNKAQQQLASGQPLNPQEVEAMRGQMGMLKEQVKLALHQRFTDSWDNGGDPTKSYSNWLDKKSQQDIMDQAMMPITIMEDALDGKNPWGVMGATAAWVKASEDATNRQILSNIPYAATIHAMSQMYGPDIVATYLQGNKEASDALVQSLSNYQAAQGAMGQGSISDAYGDGQKYKLGKDYYNSLLTNWKDTVQNMASGKLPPKIVQNNALYMFGPKSNDILSKMTDDSRYAYFRAVASPEITKQMLRLRDMGDTDTWNLYQNWVASSFQNLYQDTVRNLAGYTNREGGVGYQVQYDPDQHVFSINNAWNPVAQAFSLQNPAPDINKMNTVIQTIAPIIEANGGDVNMELLHLLGSMGFDPNAKNSNLFFDVGKAVLSGVYNIKNSAEGDVNIGSGENDPWLYGKNWRIGPFTGSEAANKAADERWLEIQNKLNGKTK